MAEGYTHIRVYTDTSETGTFTTLDGSVVLVAATPSYEYTDRDGVAATWYKSAYYGAVPGEGSKSTARKGETRAAYATVEELREEMNMTSVGDDLTLARLLDTAAINIDNACNRPDGFIADLSASARVYAGSGKPYQWIDECVSITTVATKASATDDDYTDWETTDWIAFRGDPRHPDFNNTPYTAIMVDPTGTEVRFTSGAYTTKAGFRPTTDIWRGVPTVEVTAKWGYATTVPHDIRTACLMQAAIWYKELQGAMTGTVGSPEMGELLYRNSLHPDIRRILVDGRYMRPALGRR